MHLHKLTAFSQMTQEVTVAETCFYLGRKPLYIW